MIKQWLFSAMVMALVLVSCSQTTALTYKGSPLPTPKSFGADFPQPPPAWLLVGDQVVSGTLAAGSKGGAHFDPAYALPHLPIATFRADTRIVIVVSSESYKQFKATVRPWSEDGRIVPLYDDAARELKAEVQRERNLTVFTLEPIGNAGDQLLNVNITFSTEDAWGFYLWRLNPAK